MILIGLGSNLESDVLGSPRQVCEAALRELARAGVEIERVSRWYESAPVPPSDQPWFVNAVARVRTARPRAALRPVRPGSGVAVGRSRRVRNGARVIDLDVRAYDDKVSGPGERPELPHPRLVGRAFVLVPLAEIAPGWRHPVSGRTVEDLVADLPKAQAVRPRGPG